jgi:hypothetical protein
VPGADVAVESCGCHGLDWLSGASEVKFAQRHDSRSIAKPYSRIPHLSYFELRLTGNQSGFSRVSRRQGRLAPFPPGWSGTGAREIFGAFQCFGRHLARVAMDKHRIYTTTFASVYPLYVQKAEKKGRKRQEVDEVICWLTGYSPQALAKQIKQKSDFETFFNDAPRIHPNANKITGTICGVRIEEIEHPLMRKIRYLDKLVDELAKGRPMEKILRK